MAQVATILHGDALATLRTLPAESVHCCVTSPPYWGLRNYGVDGQLGLEATPDAYVAALVQVFREVRRVLRDDGTLWLNLGSSYAAGKSGRTDDGTDDPTSTLGPNRCGLPNNSGMGPVQQRTPPPGYKPKDMVPIPWLVAIALQADGWWLRQDIIWSKPNPMPESVRDRCTKAHEYIFLLSKSATYHYDAEAVKEKSVDPDGSAARYAAPMWVGNKHESGGYSADGATHTGGMKTFDGTRNRRSVWTVATRPYSGAHFATFSPKLVEPCILAGCPEKCCPLCLTPYRQIIERTKGDTEAATRPKRTAGMASKTSTLSLSGNGSAEWAARGGKTRAIGWSPACDCGAVGTISGTVLDPFAGSGTTLAVAMEHGRNALGIELNAEYIDLARRRLGEAKEAAGLRAVAWELSSTPLTGAKR
jgi:DNA modification methylase